ncbi:MAG: hypothetical protein ACRBBV_04955 [Paracoccaceae bacterium]
MKTINLKFAFGALCCVALTACSEPKAARETGVALTRELSDGAGTIMYNCRPLTGARADEALTKAQALFEEKHYPKFRANWVAVKKMTSERKITMPDFYAVKRRTDALKRRAAKDTAPFGCTFIGLRFSPAATQKWTKQLGL